MRRPNVTFGLALAACALVAPQPARAAIVPYTSRAVFQADAGPGVNLQNFNSVVSDMIFQTQTVNFPGFSLRQEGFDRAFRNLIDAPPAQFDEIGAGTTIVSTFTNFAETATPATTVRLSFAPSVRGWGADFALGIPDERVRIDVLDAADTILATLAPADNANFTGFLATAGEQVAAVVFRSATLDPGAGGEGFTMDNFLLAPVPEPGMLALLPGAALVLARRWRRTLRI
jgi:hypothetical protein